MEFPSWIKKILIFLTSILICYTTLADENLFQQAKILQRERKFDEAIVAFRSYLSQPLDKSDLTGKQLSLYVDALVQLMKTFQSKGDPESCISTLQGHCLRDFHSVMGYALSRMEKMKEAEETMMKALSLPLYRAIPERYFRDYAYAAAVFYSNLNYQKEVIYWCQEALQQAELCKNTSGKQRVTLTPSILQTDGESKFRQCFELLCLFPTMSA